MTDRPRFYRQWLIFRPDAGNYPVSRTMAAPFERLPHNNPDNGTLNEYIRQAMAWVHHAQGDFSNGFELMPEDRRDMLGFLWGNLADSTHQVLYRTGHQGEFGYALMMSEDLHPSEEGRTLHFYLDPRADLVPELAAMEIKSAQGIPPEKREDFFELLAKYKVGIQHVSFERGSLLQALQREQGRHEFFDSVGGRKTPADCLFDDPLTFPVEASGKK